jgi:Cu2+-exporting ATPase
MSQEPGQDHHGHDPSDSHNHGQLGMLSEHATLGDTRAQHRQDHANHSTPTETVTADGREPHVGHGNGALGHDPHEDHAPDAHAGHSAAMFRSRMWLTLVLSIPVVAFSPMIAMVFGYHLPATGWTTWIAPVLGTVIFFYGGMPFLKGAVREIKLRQPGMMLLISMAITVAFIASWATSLGAGLDLDFWWELALLIVIMLLGHWLEMRALGEASSALDALAALLPDTAEVVSEDGVVVEVPSAEVSAGDLVLVRAGGRVPADGTVEVGFAEMDESMITGESAPVSRVVGDAVTAGTVATDSAIQVRVTAVGEDTALAGIRRLVTDAQASSTRAQALADRAAALLFYFAVAAAVITVVVWLIIGSPADAITRAVTVLIIACPHALGLAIPLVIAIATERAARSGVLVKDRLALERMRSIDIVMFDKTGTLTEGRHAVTYAAAVPGTDPQLVSRLAAAAESPSEHPVARAIIAWANENSDGLPIPPVTDFRSEPGVEVSGTVDGVEVRVGGPRLLADLDLTVPEGIRAEVTEWESAGSSVLFAVIDGHIEGAFALRDVIRPESRAAIDELHRRGIRVGMITGDAQQVADAVAADLGIDEVFAGVLPGDKSAKISELQGRGFKVAMVGDGVNDAPALARADVGVAIGAGTDVAIESAGVVLVSSDPRAVLSVIELSQASYRKMVQNLVWATSYNVIAVPLAAGALVSIGFNLPPAAAAVLMSLSTIIVALNAQLLRRHELNPEILAPMHTT